MAITTLISLEPRTDYMMARIWRRARFAALLLGLGACKADTFNIPQ